MAQQQQQQQGYAAAPQGAQYGHYAMPQGQAPQAPPPGANPYHTGAYYGASAPQNAPYSVGAAPVYAAGPAPAPAAAAQSQMQHYPPVPKYQAASAYDKPRAAAGGEPEARFQPDSQWRDPFWALVYIAQLLFILGLGIFMFAKYHKQLADESDSDDNGDDDESSGFSVHVTGKFVGLVVLLIASGVASAALWLSLIRDHAASLVWFTLVASVVVKVLVAILFFADGVAVAGVIFLLFAALLVLWIYLVRRRIAFAAAMMEIVAQVVKQFSAMVLYAVLGAVMQAVWLFVWVWAAACTLYAVRNSGSNGFVYFLLVLSFFWTAQVIKNIVHVTCAGTLASWYFLFPHAMPENPTRDAFKRATTSSLGSICLGSLLVAIISTIRFFVQGARRSRNGFVRACVACILGILERIANYFNMYAFTQVAIYGKTYIEAAKATWELIQSRGLSAVINDNLIGGVLMLATVMGGVMVAVVGGVMARFVIKEPDWGVWAVAGFLIGLALTLCAMEVVESCVAALFVCYAEDPAALRDSKPQFYAQLTNAFSLIYSDDASQPILQADEQAAGPRHH